jgi:hypothetical protein
VDGFAAPPQAAKHAAYEHICISTDNQYEIDGIARGPLR